MKLRNANVICFAVLCFGLLATGSCDELQAQSSSPEPRGRLALHNWNSNLAKAGFKSNIAEKDIIVTPTLVRGMYSMSDRQGRFFGFVNEAGTLQGDGHEFKEIYTDGSKPRPLSPGDMPSLRSEIMSAIDYSKLIKVPMGAKDPKRVLVFSAVDCPASEAMEKNIRARSAVRQDSVSDGPDFYVVPGSLKPISMGGLSQWQTVAGIWCASDKTTAWKTYWQKHTLPESRQCELDARGAEQLSKQLREILNAVGIVVNSSPALIHADGTPVTRENSSASPAPLVSATYRWLPPTFHTTTSN